jgi:hypothetical protein
MPLPITAACRGSCGNESTIFQESRIEIRRNIFQAIQMQQLTLHAVTGRFLYFQLTPYEQRKSLRTNNSKSFITQHFVLKSSVSKLKTKYPFYQPHLLL